MEEEFEEYAINSWNKFRNCSFVTKTKILSYSLTKWNKKKKSLQHQIASTEEEILQIQASSERHQMVDKERELFIFSGILRKMR